jgi:NAD(P)-dependent dehydrogenase (short-subunit alcohol dehydrogenase family)
MQAAEKMLQGKRVVVTGGGSGIGRAIAALLAQNGARVAVLGRQRQQLETAVGAIKAEGGQARIMQADLSDPGQVEAAFATVLEEWDGIDILVNNAGVQGPIGLTHQTDAADWARTVQINLVGPLLCIQQVLPGMIERGGGKIINLSGGGAVGPRPHFSAYGASKAGLVRLTETLAAEMAPWHIEVNAIAPGAVATRMQEEILAAGAAAGQAALEEAEQAIKADPEGTGPARAAALALFLASSRSDGLSGRLLSAVWDAWDEMDIAAVMQGEAYTVRRLKPEDLI